MKNSKTRRGTARDSVCMVANRGDLGEDVLPVPGALQELQDARIRLDLQTLVLPNLKL